MLSELALVEAASKLSAGDIPSAFTMTTNFIVDGFQLVESWVCTQQSLSLFLGSYSCGFAFAVCVITLISKHLAKLARFGLVHKRNDTCTSICESL